VAGSAKRFSPRSASPSLHGKTMQFAQRASELSVQLQNGFGPMSSSYIH
jgi:hypothetical protein